MSLLIAGHISQSLITSLTCLHQKLFSCGITVHDVMGLWPSFESELVQHCREHHGDVESFIPTTQYSVATNSTFTSNYG